MKKLVLSETGKRMLEERRQELVAELENLSPFCRGSLHPPSDLPQGGIGPPRIRRAA